MIKVLNLYVGIGGNRKLWKDVQVTAIENDREIADIYNHFFPADEIIVTDAHKYLQEHIEEFDFIWSSPPCPSHSKARYLSCLDNNNTPWKQKPIYPDMRLWQEIIFLKSYCKVPFCVENVIPFYEPLIKPQTIAKWAFWANFRIPTIKVSNRYHFNTNSELQEEKGFDISKFKVSTRKDKLLKNCVDPKLGLHILECAFQEKQKGLEDFNKVTK